MKESLVSIITPSYNSKHHIKYCIDSVRAQTYKNWEMIIVDDFSNDHSLSFIKEYILVDCRISLIELKSNVGAAIARNYALEKAQGRYIAFLDSDDAWAFNKLEKQISFMVTHGYPISFTAYEIINENGLSTNHFVSVVKKIGLYGYLKNTIIGFSTAVIDKKLVYEEIKFLDIRIRQDANLWISLFKNGYEAYGLNEILAKYRVHSNSISSNKLMAATKVWILYYKIHKFGLLKSIYYFVFYTFNATKKRLISAKIPVDFPPER